MLPVTTMVAPSTLTSCLEDDEETIENFDCICGTICITIKIIELITTIIDSGS